MRDTVTTFPKTAPKGDVTASDQDDLGPEVMLLLRLLTDDQKRRLLAVLSREVDPIPAPRAGEVLGTIVSILRKRPEWTVREIRAEVEGRGVQATQREVHNAISYLARRGHIRRMGYGQYLVGGAGLVTEDDMGLPPVEHDE